MNRKLQFSKTVKIASAITETRANVMVMHFVSHLSSTEHAFTSIGNFGFLEPIESPGHAAAAGWS